MMKFLAAALAACLFFAAATPWLASKPGIAPRAEEVEVTVLGGTIIGAVTEVESFNGIPFADPRVNELRLKPPRRREVPLGLHNVAPFYSTVHDTDVQLIFEGQGIGAGATRSTRKYYISFVDSLDPKVPETGD